MSAPVITTPERPFSVVPASAAGLRLLIVNPGYFLWPIALVFLVLVVGPVLARAAAPPPAAERTLARPSAADAGEQREQIEQIERERGWGACLRGPVRTPAGGGMAAGAGVPPPAARQPFSSPAALGAVFALAIGIVIALIMVQGAVFRLLLGREEGGAVRFGEDELRLLVVNVAVPVVAALGAAPFAAIGLGVMALPGPCGALTGGAALVWLLGGLAAAAVLARLACIGPAVVDHSRFAVRSGLAAARGVADLVITGGVAGVTAMLLLSSPLPVAAAVLSGRLGGGGEGGNERGAGAPVAAADDPVAALSMHVAVAVVVFLVVVTLSSLAAYAYVRVTQGRDPDALAIARAS